MKHLLLLSCTLLLTALTYGQITIQNNMPPVIDPAGATVQVKIHKGAITNFARYQMDVPAGVTIQEDDSRNGTFAFENDHVKIFWADIPADSEITISVKFAPGTFSGPARITQKFYYMEEGTKKETDGDTLEVTFKGDDSKNTTNLGALPNSTNSPNSSTEKLQAEQLKKDSKEAYNTGLKEKQAADKKLSEANAAIKKAEALQNEEEKQAALKSATAQKQKAESDKAVASKILALARSLDDNANEIERLNKTAPAASSSGPAAVTPAPVVSDTGIVYRLQLGAFSQNPEKVLYKHMGLINIVNEDGMYKVLMGKYTTREDAVKKRGELIARSFDCFIVTYKGGVRVKQ